MDSAEEFKIETVLKVSARIRCVKHQAGETASNEHKTSPEILG